MEKFGINHEWGWVQIELTDVCNFNCIMCPQGQGFDVHRIFEEGKSDQTFIFEPSQNELKKIKKVHLVGDFNYWGFNVGEKIWYANNPNSLMEKTGSGLFTKKIELFPGSHKYQFIVQYEDGTQKVNPYFSEIDNGDKKIVYDGEFFIRCINPNSKNLSGFMSEGLFRKILTDFVVLGEKFNEIALFWNGESLLHSKFEKLLGILYEINLNHKIFEIFGLHANASLLTEEKALALLKLTEAFPGYSKISFSIDAVNKATYDKIRQGGIFNR